jgi:hypothetical protein
MSSTAGCTIPLRAVAAEEAFMAQQTTVDPPREVQGLVATLDEYFVQKAPFQIPDPGKELLVRLGPWIALVLLILLVPFVLVALGIGTLLVPFHGVGYAAGFGLTAILSCVQIVLIAAALPGLFAGRISGWTLLFYEQLLSIAAGLLRGSIVWTLIGAIVGLYLLFQVRGKYR